MVLQSKKMIKESFCSYNLCLAVFDKAWAIGSNFTEHLRKSSAQQLLLFLKYPY